MPIIQWKIPCYRIVSFSQPPQGFTLERAHAMCHGEPKHFLFHTQYTPFKGSVFLEDISGEEGLAQVMAWHECLRMKYAILKNDIMAFQGENWKRYFKSPDNKINRQLPSGGICLWLTKATVSAVCLKRPPHSLIVLTVRFFCPHL